MSQMTLFKPPDILTERVKELKDNSELDREQAQLLLQVELGFALMEHQPFLLRIPDLESNAEFLDRREQLLARRYGWNETQKGHWVSRFRKINFHKIQEDGTLSERNTQALELDGFVHLAGQVASGKSTLSTLLAVDVLRNHPDRRITLVVSDVQSAIRLANQINWWFCNDPENNEPVAVPLLGRSKRDAHLQSFYASKDFQEHWRRGQPHWGDRFLGTACALQGLLTV
ncbi:hypothetical protein [uncultured Nostoc sp.]|uniref:hypothetical protein n=1 Tax=uncultured Nostoc sp. TaxID=340711 RepID=UPI0035CBC9E6